MASLDLARRYRESYPAIKKLYPDAPDYRLLLFLDNDEIDRLVSAAQSTGDAWLGEMLELLKVNEEKSMRKRS